MKQYQCELSYGIVGHLCVCLIAVAQSSEVTSLGTSRYSLAHTWTQVCDSSSQAQDGKRLAIKCQHINIRVSCIVDCQTSLRLNTSREPRDRNNAHFSRYTPQSELLF